MKYKLHFLQFASDDGGPHHNTNRRFLYNLRCPLHRLCGGSEGGGGLLLPQPCVRLWRRARPVHWIQLSDGHRLCIYFQCKPFKVTINISYHRCRIDVELFKIRWAQSLQNMHVCNYAECTWYLLLFFRSRSLVRV